MIIRNVFKISYDVNNMIDAKEWKKKEKGLREESTTVRTTAQYWSIYNSELFRVDW